MRRERLLMCNPSEEADSNAKLKTIAHTATYKVKHWFISQCAGTLK